MIDGIPKPLSGATVSLHLRADAGGAHRRDRPPVLCALPAGSGGGEEGDDALRR